MYQYNVFDFINRELIIDNFAGGGGASCGIELATGRSPDCAINHDPDAILMHKTNHPHTVHYCESVWDVKPLDITQGKPVALCWFSPDCKHFSKAKGSKPVEKNIRGLAWVAVRWAATVKPRVIMLENVEEFKTWGPLKDGYPDPKKKGKTFLSFVNALQHYGYKVDWKELKACDYGAPTIRKRFFLVARCDGKPIQWPKPTHGKHDSAEVLNGKLKPWRTAAEIIDWSIPCPSIFERKKPLAENTLKRIARGIQKFVIDNPKPFIVRIGQTGFGGDKLQYSIDKPLTTVTTKAEHCLVTPTLIQYHTETSSNSVRGQVVTEPIMTIDSSNRYALVSAFIERQFKSSIGHVADEPLGTVTTVDKSRLITTFIAKHYGGNYQGAGSGLNEPLPTVTTVDHSSLVYAFLVKYYSGEEQYQAIDEPLHTITTLPRFALVTLNGEQYKIVDIGMRMLEPHELFKAQGFPDNYIIDKDYEGKVYPKTKQIARCGNAVPPPFAKALVEANLPELCENKLSKVVGLF